MTKNDVKITETVFRLCPYKDKGTTLSYTDFCFSGLFKIRDAMIVKSHNENGLRVVYPIKYCKNGSTTQTFAPIKKEIAIEMERQILEAYKERIK